MNQQSIRFIRSKRLLLILQGFSIGMIVSSGYLAPKSTTAGDKYMLWFVSGAILYAATVAWGWVLHRQTMQALRQANQKTVTTK